MTLLKIKTKESIPSSFERLLNELLDEANKKDKEELLPTFIPPVNIIERKENYEIQVALPGWEKKEIQISLDSKLLSVSGSKETRKEKNHIVYRNDFSGRFERKFKLPEEASDSIKAELKNGVLYIVIEKEQKKETKRAIEVL